MSIEKKRNLLRISKEKAANPHLQVQYNNQIINSAKPEMNTIFNPIHIPENNLTRIKTEIKSQNLGKNLNPDYIGKYKGGSFIVAGCGTSVSLYNDFSKYFVIGVNDIERILTPDFLVVVNDSRTFSRGRWEFVRDTKSPVIFSHLDNPGQITRSENLVKVRIGERNFPNLDKMDSVDYTMNSPYMAVIIAYQLGARKIGIIGVDFTQDHFFQKTGIHKLSKHLKSIDTEYAVLRKLLETKGVQVANLSSISLLESWPKMTLDQFDLL